MYTIEQLEEKIANAPAYAQGIWRGELRKLKQTEASKKHNKVIVDSLNKAFSKPVEVIEPIIEEEVTVDEEVEIFVPAEEVSEAVCEPCEEVKVRKTRKKAAKKATKKKVKDEGDE